MTTYLLSMVQPTGPIPPPEVLGPIMEELGKVREELDAGGSWVFGNGLFPPETATVLRTGGIVTDGPFAEGKEYVGGITIIDVADLDAALTVARRYVDITGLTIEVRPFQG